MGNDCYRHKRTHDVSLPKVKQKETLNPISLTKDRDRSGIGGCSAVVEPVTGLEIILGRGAYSHYAMDAGVNY